MEEILTAELQLLVSFSRKENKSGEPGDLHRIHVVLGRVHFGHHFFRPASQRVLIKGAQAGNICRRVFFTQSKPV